jgi:hypothetical protein
MPLRTENYLITAEIRYENDFRNKYNQFVKAVRKISKVVDSKTFTRQIIAGFRHPAIRVQVTADNTEKEILDVANMLEDFGNTMFGEDGLLVDELQSRMNNISGNVAKRFFLNTRPVTGNLADALESQDVLVEAHPKGIIGALINWRNLDTTLTSRQKAIRKKRAQTAIGSYPYQTPGGEISVQSYWAFIDQGFVHYQTGALVPGRNFILNSQGQYHEEDVAELNEIQNFLVQSIKELNSNTASILS